VIGVEEERSGASRIAAVAVTGDPKGDDRHVPQIA